MNQLTLEIYQQLLEYYISDLEVELLAEKIKNVNIGVPQIPVRHPWDKSDNPYIQPRNPWDTPYYYGPLPYTTCSPLNTTWTNTIPLEKTSSTENGSWSEP